MVSTDLYTGHEVWYSEGQLVPAIRASFSLPGLFEPVQVDGRWVVDGALVNPVPVSVCHALGAQIVIAVNLQTSFLTPPFGFALFYLRGVSPSSVSTGEIYRGVLPFIILQLLLLLILLRWPGLTTWLPGLAS